MRSYLISALAALLLAGDAVAQEAPATAPADPTPATAQAAQAIRGACAADTQKLCSGVQPGGGRIMQCFRDHAAELTPACRDALMQLRGAGGARRRGR